MSKNIASAMGEKLEGLMIDEAAKFVKGNSAAAQKLGESVVRLIFSQEFEAAMGPGIVEVLDGASLEFRTAVSEVNLARTLRFQLISKAEEENAELVAQVRASAVNTMVNIAKGLVGIVGGFSAGIIKG